jgi:hypothetical protein
MKRQDSKRVLHRQRQALKDGVTEMTSNTIGRSGRFRLPKLAKPRSQTAVFCKRRRNRIAFVVALLALLCCSATQGYAAENLECPEIGPGRVPDLIGDATGGGLLATENRIELANEINDATNRLQISDPNIVWSDVQNVLIAAYCRVVSRKAGLTAAERWDRMRQFVSVLEQQIAANRLAPGTLLIANVPPPDVFRELRSQAAASGQTTTQLMAAILTRAAGK